jgi:hypothetical protein
MIIPPGREMSAFSKLFTAFDETLWCALCALMLFVVFITLILTKCHSGGRRRRDVRDFVLGKENRTPFLNIVSIMVGVPWHSVPKRNFSRWLLTMFLVMWLIIRSLYQAVLYKNLQATERKLPVQSINESLELSFVYFMLISTQDNIIYLPDVYNRRIIVTRNESEIVIARKFTDPDTKAAFLGGEDIVKYSNKMNLYGYKALICPEPLMLRQYGIFYPKNSYLKSLFDIELLKLVDAGLIDYWRQNLTEMRREKVSKFPQKLTLIHLLSAFELLFVGVLIAFTFFLIELLSLKVKKIRIVLEREGMKK